ncbi:MAG: LysM peptidoglycan-binding domain-containing protein [Gammaproteobacteria bacterium]|nr:MAG: LysM peptidoglycan-binding domain-containing protein [Gammaproteobacteria bacterium]
MFSFNSFRQLALPFLCLFFLVSCSLLKSDDYKKDPGNTSASRKDSDKYGISRQSDIKIVKTKKPDRFSNFTPIRNTELFAKGFVNNRDSKYSVITDSASHSFNITNYTISSNIWNIIRRGFKLTTITNDRIVSDINRFAKHPSYVAKVAERSRPYLHYIVSEAVRRDIPLEIALLPVVESAFQPFAYSHGRASGIWQFIPSTGKRFGLEQNWWYDGRRDVVASTHAAFNYLEYLAKMFDGDWLLALAAYNSGEGTVLKAVRKNRKAGLPTDYWNLSLPKETEGYVPKLLAYCTIIKKPSNFGVSLPTIYNKKYFELVKLDSQLDLAIAANLAQMPLKDLYILNPGFNRWATPPNGKYNLAIPVDSAEIFKTELGKLPKSKRIKWVRHKIQSGEALLTIAKKYNTTVNLIRKSNNFTGNSIRAGKYLIIPVSYKDDDNYTLSSQNRKEKQLSKNRKGKKIIHTVKSGDTLWDISRKYNISHRSLAKWNAMAPGDNLALGQELVIWKNGSPHKNKTPNSSVKKERSFSPDDIKKTIYYKVRSGDSIYTIARKFKVTVKEMKAWNRSLRKAKYIQPGQTVRVKVSITAQY